LGGPQRRVYVTTQARGLPASSARASAVSLVAGAASTTPSAAAKAQASATAESPVVKFLAGALSAFGLNAPTAPTNPVGASVWGLFRRVETVVGVVPIAGAATVSQPNLETGAVTGTPGFTVPAGLPLTYSAPTTSTGGGTVSIDASTGAYTYTPTVAMWLAAANSPTRDSFTVTASDGLAATTKTVTIPIGPPIKVTATIPVGETPSAVAVSPDGSHVYVTYSPRFGRERVAVINTATDTVSTTISVGGATTAVAVSPRRQPRLRHQQRRHGVGVQHRHQYRHHHSRRRLSDRGSRQPRRQPRLRHQRRLRRHQQQHGVGALRLTYRLAG
jgi:VCBS repeat-containing protein